MIKKPFTDEQESLILSIDPFEGDMGGDVVHFKNCMVNGNKEHICNWCNSKIAIGERQRKIVDKFDGEMMSYRYCRKCCLAMYKDAKGDGYSNTEKRIELGKKRGEIK